ncbi:MAG: hypothetical protein J6J64_00520 [Alistipes sp.]|nr:hypothetical protein [Alistipes sp.]
MREIRLEEQPYTAPIAEAYTVDVELGFNASYGDVGEAGEEFDVNDNGIF